MVDSICTPHFDTGGIAIDSTREYSMEDHEPLSSKENTTRDTLPEVVDEGEYCTEYIEGGNTTSTTPSMSRIHEVQYLEKAPATPSSSTDSRLVDNIERMGNMNTRGDMRNMTDGNMKCSFTEDEMCVIHDVRGTVIPITAKKWKKNARTGLFRYVSIRTKKLICKAKKIVPVVPDIATGVLSQRLEDNNTFGASGKDIQTDGLPDNLLE